MTPYIRRWGLVDFGIFTSPYYKLLNYNRKKKCCFVFKNTRMKKPAGKKLRTIQRPDNEQRVVNIEQNST